MNIIRFASATVLSIASLAGAAAVPAAVAAPAQATTLSAVGTAAKSTRACFPKDNLCVTIPTGWTWQWATDAKGVTRATIKKGKFQINVTTGVGPTGIGGTPDRMAYVKKVAKTGLTTRGMGGDKGTYGVVASQYYYTYKGGIWVGGSLQSTQSTRMSTVGDFKVVVGELQGLIGGRKANTTTFVNMTSIKVRSAKEAKAVMNSADYKAAAGILASMKYGR